MNPYTRMLEDAGTHPRSVIVAWGANHNFFNSEWQVSDAVGCRGSQSPLWDSMAPTREVRTSVELPEDLQKTDALASLGKENLQGVRVSERQQAIARMLMTAFFKAHVGQDKNARLASVFDAGTALPPERSELTSYSRESRSPGDGASWPVGTIAQHHEEGKFVTISPLSDFLDAEWDILEKKLRTMLGSNGPVVVEDPRTMDSAVVRWGEDVNGSSTPPRVSIRLPEPVESPESLLVVLANYSQARPCLKREPEGSCRGLIAPLDFSIQIVNPDGSASIKHRVSEFLALRPHLQSNISWIYKWPGDPSDPRSVPFVYANRNEPVFDTLALPLKAFTTFDGKPFPLLKDARLRLIFEHTRAGTLALRNVYLREKRSLAR